MKDPLNPTTPLAPKCPRCGNALLSEAAPHTGILFRYCDACDYVEES